MATSKYSTSYQVAAYLQFVGKPVTMSLDIKPNAEVDIFKIELDKFSLDTLITGIVQIVKPGFVLNIPKPWRHILNFEVDKITLLLKIPKDPKKKNEFGIEFNPHFDDFGLKISKIQVFAQSVREVNVNMEGDLNIFGIKFDLADLFNKGEGVNLLGAEGLPTPAPKPGIFELNFIGIGQHLELANAAKYNHVKDVIDDMVKLFDPPAPGTVVPAFNDILKFSNDSQWLFGLDIDIMKTLALKIVFNDPVLYGLYIGLRGDKAKVLAGLEFEILYKKVTDDIGVYQIELKLPDAIRNMEFGAVSITLPVIAIWIYTNGNFKIDLGFPYNNDFSRSFTVQAMAGPIPLIGQGGFYFAYLNGATSTTVPKTELGTFDPVLEFGIGMNIGLGKTFNKGILSAGLTLTFYGILEGTLAWFKPYDNTLPTSTDNTGLTVDTSLTDFFYRVKGTFGIIGHIYGSVNFAIISATLDIIVYAQATVLIEAGEAILLAFEAGVSIRLTVKINLGLFKIKIHLSFSATIRESFTLGSPSKTQWNTPLMVAAADGNSLGAPIPLTDDETHVFITMNWDQTLSQGTAQNLTTNLIPLFSASKTTDTQTAVGVSTLFVENNRGENNEDLKKLIIDKDALAADSAFQTFDRLCISLLSWILNTTYKAEDAAKTFEELLDKKITNVTIANILYTIDNYDAEGNPNPDNGTVPFTYEQAVDFIKALFVLDITDINDDYKKSLKENPELTISEDDQSNLFVTIFPMIPQLFMSNSENSDVINFNTYNGVNSAYLKKVLELVSQFTNADVDSSDDGKGIDITNTESIAALIFRDYFSLIGKSLLQTASDVMEVYNYKLPNATLSLNDIAETFDTTPAALVETNKAQEGILIEGKNIAISGSSYSFADKETFTKLESLHTYVSSGTDWASEFVTLNGKVKMLVPMCQIKISETGPLYRVLEGDTFETIAKTNSLSAEETAGIIALNKDNTEILTPLTSVILPAYNKAIKADATFLSISTEYGIELSDISDANKENSDLMNSESEMMIQYVSQLSVEDLLNAVYQNDFFTGAGGSASRFAMHGVRLPNVITDGDSGTDLEGLYDLSGQQFSLPTIPDPTTFTYTFTLRKTAPGSSVTEDPLPWILFNGTSFTGSDDDKKLATLPYALIDDEKKLAQQFQKLVFSPTVLNGPSNLQLYQDQTKTFPFSNPIVWQREGASVPKFIWSFSKSLTGITNKNPEVILNVAVQAKPNEGRTITPISKYDYSTLLPLTIRKLDDGSSEGINKRTFEVFGTDATGIETLTALLKDIHFEDLLKDIKILYSSDPTNDEAKELRSISSEELLLLLINTNLSTETNPQNVTQSDGDEKISNTPVTTFIERVWKSSLVRTGGYYLYYATKDDATLPDNLFSDTGEAEIYFLISYNKPVSPGTENTLQPYMNSAVLRQQIDTSQELLFGEWDVDLDKTDHNTLLIDGKIERNSIIKPGNVGFELTRENPSKKYGDATGKVTEPNYPYDLEQQYNLLNFKTLGTTNIEALSSVIPVGPTDNQDSTSNDVTNDDDSLLDPWKYSKAMPVAKFYKGAGDPTDLITIPPPANLSPYLGLKDTLQIAFDWQDNYGNIYNESVPDLSYTILYFDEIIPLSAWPALTLEYWFATPGEDKNNFNLALTFIPGDKYSWDPNGDNPTQMKDSILKQANADIQKYISVYYQIEQDDLDISFLVSADPGVSHPPKSDKKALKDGVETYITTVMQWINKFIADQYQHVYTYSSIVNVTNEKDIFSLTIQVVLERNEDSIDPQFILQNSPKIFAPGVQSIQSTAKPKSSGLPAPPDFTSDNSSLLALTNFAYSFEQAFGDQELKVTATYVRGEDSSLTTEKEEELWIVRFKEYNASGNGIGYDIMFNEALYYAPQPLANFLISLQNIPISPYSSYELNGEPSATNKTYNNIDAEIWARSFLAALETTFSPEMSLPITMIDHLNGKDDDTGTLSSLLASKQMLADAIALQTIPILQDAKMQKAGWNVAREKLRQQLLINLVDGYNVSSVIQYNTNVNTPYPNDDQPIAPNLYGKPFVDYIEKSSKEKSSKEKNYSFSTGKVPLLDLDTVDPSVQTTYLTSTFTTQNPTLESNLPLPVNYQINHMEFDITSLENAPSGKESEDLKNYDLSKWLTFILPVSVQNSSDERISHIPIPIRQYPILPAFGSQLFQSDVTSKKESITIEKAKLSDFSFDYTLSTYVAQDAYHFEIYFNAKEADWPLLEKTRALSDKQKALFSTLAQFNYVRQDFLNTFSDELPKIDASISKDELEKITKLLVSYDGLVSDASVAWLNLFTEDPEAAATPSVDVVKVEFKLKEQGSDIEAGNDSPDNHFEVLISNWSATVEEKPISYVHFPTIFINDYEVAIFVCDKVNCKNPIALPEGKNLAEYAQVIFRYYKTVDNKKQYLSFIDGTKIENRNVEFTALSVLQVQNGWAGFYVERNADLSGNTDLPLETSPEFIYSTPVRRFNNPITPSVKVTNQLPLTPLGEKENNLIDYLKELLKELMSTVDGNITPVKLKILVNYKYSTVSEYITLPVILMSPTIFDGDDVNGKGDGIKALQEGIFKWFENNTPIQNLGELIFSITFYSSIDGDNTLPLLNLEDITLLVKYVEDLKTLSPK
jgi:hypothetical protein